MRRTMLTRRAALAGAALTLSAPAVLGQAKSKYAGTTIRGAAFSLPFHGYLRNYFPEFEDRTGIKIDFDIQAFPVYNQRMDLELSTGGSSYDVIIVTFIYQGRWIGAGWVTRPRRIHQRRERHAARLGSRRISSPARNPPCATPRATPTATASRPAP